MGRHLDLSGIVIPGRGLGVVRLSSPELIERLREVVGFPVVPGTLNVRLPEPFNRGLTSRYLAAAEISPDWEAETGQAGYFLVPGLIAGRYRCAAFSGRRARVPHRPDRAAR